MVRVAAWVLFFVLALCWLALTANAQTPPPPVGTPAGGCLFCHTVAQVEGLALRFAPQAFDYFANALRALFGLAALMSLSWAVAAAFFLQRNARRVVSVFVGQLVVLAVGAWAMSPGLAWAWIGGDLFRLPASLASAILGQSQQLGLIGVSDQGGWLRMWSLVEAIINPLFSAISSHVTSLNIGRALSGLLIAVPWILFAVVFLVTIFLIILELMLLWAVLPLLMVLGVFRRMRPMLWRALSIFLEACFFAVFAATILAFQAYIMAEYLETLSRQSANTSSFLANAGRSILESIRRTVTWDFSRGTGRAVDPGESALEPTTMIVVILGVAGVFLLLSARRMAAALAAAAGSAAGDGAAAAGRAIRTGLVAAGIASAAGPGPAPAANAEAVREMVERFRH